MAKNIKKKYTELSMPVKTLIGVCISCLIGFISTLVLSIFFSYILSKSPEISKFIGAYFIISVLSGAFVSGFAGSKLLSFKGIISGLICSFPFSALTFAVMLLTSSSQLTGFSIILLIMIILLCVIGGIVSANMKRRK